MSQLTQAMVGRYTVVRSGQRRLYVPNAAFLTREFLVVDDPEAGERKRSLEGPVMAPPAHAYVQGPDGHPRWMPVQPFDGYSHFMVDPRSAASCSSETRVPLFGLWELAPAGK